MKERRVSWIDGGIILLLVCILVGVYFWFSSMSAPKAVVLQYTVVLNAEDDVVHLNDVLTDAKSNIDLGTVTSIEALADGSGYRVGLTVSGKETNSAIRIGDAIEIRCQKPIYIAIEDQVYEGYVDAIERKDERVNVLPYV